MPEGKRQRNGLTRSHDVAMLHPGLATASTLNPRDAMSA